MNIIYALCTTLIILSVLYLFKISSEEREYSTQITYFYAIPLSYVFGLIISFQDVIIKYINLSIFNILIGVAAFCISIFLLLKQTENTGYAEAIDDMSGSLFFIFSILPSKIYLMIYVLVFVVILVKYQFIDESDNDDILNVLISIAVSGLSIVLWTIIIELLIDKIFVFNIAEKIIYVALLLLISEIVVPIINSFISQKVYNKMSKHNS